MSDPIIRTRGLSKTYNGSAVATHALRDVSLEIDRGSFCCIVGPSGHGKSTLMHLIGGLDRPTSGSVAVAGQELSVLSDVELARLRGRTIGFVFQFFNLLRNLTAAENVEAAMMLAGLPDREQKARARELLARVGLAERAESRPHQLSGGQQQRVAIARALANDPEILLMDEPTGNLDSVSEAQVLELLHDLHAEGKTIVLVTHSREIAQQSQRTLQIQDGRLLAA